MKVVVIQQRPGIGDLVIFLSFIRKIVSKFNSPVSLLVKANSKAEEILKYDRDIDQIIYLDRSANKKGSHDGLGFFHLVEQIRKHRFDKVFIFYAWPTI